MNNRIPEGAVTVIKDITPGMMVKVKGDPVLHKCLSNDIYDDDSASVWGTLISHGVDEWGMLLGHEPRMEYYDEHEHAYKYSASDYVHVDCIEYALPPIPPGYLAVARRDGGTVLVEVAD